MRLSKKILASVKISAYDSEVDQRPYAEITINGVSARGLLDSGASVSCLGANAIEQAKKFGLKVKRMSSAVQTADGASQQIIGYIDAPTKFRAKCHLVRFYLIPSLSNDVYLGIDFWSAFGLAPRLVEEISCPPKNVDRSNMHQLNEEQSRRLKETTDLFPSSDVDGLGKTTLLQHVIDTGAHEPVKQRYYAISPGVQQLIDIELERMLKLGVVEPSQSPWSSPMVLIRKDTGKNRLCLDSRELNKLTVKDAYPLPIINGLLSRLGDTVYISSIDLKDAFWQIELDEHSRPKTAFTVPGRPLYQFRRMPFGLCNAAQTMCRLMDKVMGSDLRESVFVYIDDLLIVSPDFDSHLEILRKVAERLRKANLTINLSKSHFMRSEIRYLGYIVGHGQLMTDPEKVKAVADFPVPKSIRQVRRFLGMTGWYQRFIENFSTIAAPMTDLVGKKSKFEWTDQAQLAFVNLKKALSSAPVLSSPDFSRPFFIQCDASMVGVGSVLFQVMADGQEHPIAYFSKKLNAAQRKYSVTELECYAAVLSVKNFRPYVELMPFTIITDHASLKWLMGQKDLSGRLGRWSLKLQSFDFKIEHRKGSMNVVPDALSRAHLDEITPNTLVIDMSSSSFNSEEYLKLIERVKKDQDRLPDLSVREGKVYRRSEFQRNQEVLDRAAWKLWVPTALTHDLISRAHNPPIMSHGGVAKTLDRLRTMFYWPNMAAQVRAYIKNCDICKVTKAPNVVLRPLMGNQMEVLAPFQRLYVDLLGPYPRSKSGNVSLLIVLDQFSKFVFLKPLRKADASNIVNFIESEVFHLFGVAESVLTDNGVQFLSKEFKSFLEKNGVTHITTATHSPQVNASERVNRSILAAVRSYIDDDQRTWDVHISAIACALRTSIHESIGFSPHYVVFGRQHIQHGSIYALLTSLNELPLSDTNALLPNDFHSILYQQVQDRLRRAHEKHEKTYNVRGRPINYRVGQEIFRRNFVQSDFAKNFNAKLAKKFVKCRVVRKIGNVLYELEDMQGKPIVMKYHAKDLRP